MNEILYNVADSVATIILNRPEKRNALDDAMIDGLRAAFEEAGRDDAICAVVIRGDGNDFCSGADLSALRKIAESDVVENLADAEKLMNVLAMIRRVRVPVIAAVHGRALAGGCGLATACDLIVATKTARFGYPEVKIGFVPAMVTAILRRNLSEKRAFELLTRGFEFTAEEALNFGLINRVLADDEFDEGVENFVAPYRKLSRSAVYLTKKLLYQMDGMTFDAALETGAEVNAIARLTADCQSGIKRFLDKT